MCGRQTGAQRSGPLARLGSARGTQAMNFPSRFVVLAAVFFIALAAGHSPAAVIGKPQAANLTQGLVTGVHRVNGQPAFSVRAAEMNNLAALAANHNGAAPVLRNAQRFLVGPGTRFEVSLGMNVMPASFAAL